MAEGDQILIQTIKNLYSDGDFETCQKLSDFSTDFVLESTAKMLNVIFNPQKPFETEKPPQSMSARYKFGSKLAQLCLELGFQGQDLGYQTFLYSNENDLRTVFMFLMDKLPKDTEHFTKKSLSSSELKKQEIKKSLNKPKTQQNSKPFDAWDVQMTDEELFRLLPKETRAAALDARIKLCSLIQQNEELKVGKIQNDDPSMDSRENFKLSNINSGMTEIIATSEEPVADAIVSTENEDKTDSEPEKPLKPLVPAQDSKIQALKSKKESAEQELESLFKEYKTAMKNLKKQKAHQISQENQYQELLNSKTEKENNLNQRLKVMDLLPSGEENVDKLKAIIGKKKTKIIGLQDQWEMHKQSLLEDQEKMKQQILKLRNRPGSTNSIKNQITLVEDQLKKQNTLATKLKKQLENAPTDYLPRSDYTKQIMDILNNVAKQKNETTKVIEEIRFIQKDINSLEGKLGRTYADADHILFEQAKKDKSLVPGYKLLVEIHKASDDIIETVRETGRMKRSTQALQESANAERSKKVNDKVTKLKADLAQLKNEVDSSQK